MKSLYLGWDVGGWHGRSDGLSILAEDKTGRLVSVGTPWQGNLTQGLFDIGCHPGNVRDLPKLCKIDTPSDSRLILGIDAPFRFPRVFNSLVNQELALHIPGRGKENMIDNRLAYRECEQFIATHWKRIPLSASFDRLGNNATKAMSYLHFWTNRSDHASPNNQKSLLQIPFDSDDGKTDLSMEAYPALWKSRPGTKAPWRTDVSALLGSDLETLKIHSRDACLCALTAACYDRQARDLPHAWPKLAFPDDFKKYFNPKEGWIYVPAPDSTLS